jgi:streptogramin lyase
MNDEIQMTKTATILREHGPFPGADKVAGVTHDGRQLWLAVGHALTAIDPASGEPRREIAVEADAGTAFDGRHLWQIAGTQIQKIDPASGEVVSTIPAPGEGRDSGLTWAEGRLWVGEYRARKIHQIDPGTGAILRVIESDRFVTGVCWTDGELWHGTFEAEQGDLRRVDPESGEVTERLSLPAGVGVSGLDADDEHFYCGGGTSGKVRVVRKPKRR